jgi:Bacterial Ig-like domain
MSDSNALVGQEAATADSAPKRDPLVDTYQDLVETLEGPSPTAGKSIVLAPDDPAAWSGPPLEEFPLPDKEKPRVIDNTPTGNQEDVAINVATKFSEAINPDTLRPENFTLVEKNGPTTTGVEATVSYDPRTRTATLDPTQNLKPGKQHEATVKGGSNGVKDLAGNELAEEKVVWNFTTKV